VCAGGCLGAQRSVAAAAEPLLLAILESSTGVEEGENWEAERVAQHRKRQG